MDKVQIDEIKRSINILDVIGDYVELHRAGKGYKALCPFHVEKTPSFYVMPDRQFYHCFGCGKGGDVISFVMDMEGLKFTEAVELLAKRAGIVIKSAPERGGHKSLTDVMEKALSIYRDCLEGASGEIARRYLIKRDLPKEWWSHFEIGWAPPAWDYLWRAFSKAGIPAKAVIECGLVVEGSRGLYDRFRGRVIFPVRDVTGRLVGFGGRSLSGEGAKYINTPEGPLFHKGSCLYLLNLAKDAIRERGRAILVEGYMDAIRLHMAGFREAVASLGTALTEEQGKLLKRFTNSCYVCYDADSAGREASIRGMYILQALGLQVNIVSLPPDRDPDEFLQEKGGKAFEDLLKKSLPLPLYHIKIREDLLNDLNLRKKVVEELIEGLSRIDLPDLAPFIPQIAAKLGMPRHALEDELLSVRANIAKTRGEKKGKRGNSSVYINAEEQKKRMIDAEEAALFSLLWNDLTKRYNLNPEDIFPLISDDRLKTLIAALLNGEQPEELEERWLKSGDRFPLEALALGNAFCQQFDDKTEIWDVIVNALKVKAMKSRYNALYSKMLKGEATRDEIEEVQKIASVLKGGKIGI